MNEQRLARLERDVRRLRAYALITSALIAVLAVAAFGKDQVASGILRARGLVIEDARGRERILLGAPIPLAANRVRTDSSRVARIWGPRFPKTYLGYYRSYRHDMNGMLVLDSLGFDRLAVGHEVPDPNIGRRIGPSTGIAINDSLGFERSGYGLLTVGGRDRVGLGLDRADGEAVALFVDDEGRAGFMARDSSRSVYLGAAPADDAVAGTRRPYFGLLVRAGATIRHNLPADPVP